MFGKLSWSHYLELLKCDDELEMQFYMTQAVQENWSVRGLKRQISSGLFQRFAARYQLYLPNKAELQEQLNQLMAK